MALLGWIAVPNKWMTNLYGFDGCTGIASVQFFPKSKMAAGVVYYYCSPRLFEFYFFRFFFCCVFFLDYLWGLQTISLCSAVFVCVTSGSPESDLDLELRGGGGGAVFCPLPCRLFFLLPSFFFFFFLPKLRGGGGGGGWAKRPPPQKPPPPPPPPPAAGPLGPLP